jgi:hypothetical protein
MQTVIPHYYNTLNLKVQETTLLPYQIYYDACSLLTKEDIQVASGEWVHCYTVKDTLFVSPQLSMVLRELATEG